MPRKKIPYNTKVLQKLEDNSKTDASTGCKLWLGGLASNGHGKTSFHNKTVLVHRLAMHLLEGFDLASPLQINHSRECKNANCWLIAHLYQGTQKDNMQDRKAAKTHCPRGHEYNNDNTLLTWNKKLNARTKNCRACHNDRQKLRRELRRELRLKSL